MVEYDLLISPIFKSLSKLRKLGVYRRLIQNSNFEYGVKIKNVGDASFDGGVIKNIKIAPLKKDVDFDILSEKRLEIPLLNPGDISIIWFDRARCPVSGTFWLDFDLEDKIKSKTITYQKAIHLAIKDEHLLQQEITNYLLIALTIIAMGISIWRLIS